MPLTLQVCSDLHLEGRDPAKCKFEDFITPSADVLALVGDIGQPAHPLLAPFLKWCGARFQHVIYVAGNHEYYSGGATMAQIAAALRQQCAAAGPNVHFLDNETLQLQEVLFIGTTLWSHVPVDKEAAVLATLNDFRFIWPNESVITPAYINGLFKRNVAFVERCVAEAAARRLKAVVLTHHVPSLVETSAPQFLGKDHNCMFATQLCCHHAPGAIRLWCAGHTHFNFNHAAEGYPLVSNQVGYHKPMTTYDPRMRIAL